MIKFNFRFPVDLLKIKNCFDNGGNVYLSEDITFSFCVEYFYQYIELMENSKKYIFNGMIFPFDEKKKLI